MAEKDFVKLKNVTKIYQMGEVQIRAVDGIDFSIDKGEFVVVVGPSGAGKTTVLNILGGMDKASGGEVLVDGKDIAGYSQKQLTGYRRNDIGFVFQFYNLVPNLTALENVELALQISRNPLDAKTVMQEVGLGDRLNNFPAQLSGGEQQRVILARALAQQTPCLILDEPTNHLDITHQLQLLKIVKKLDATVISAIHDLNIAAMFCDRIYVLKNGEIVAQGTPREILTRELIREIYEVESDIVEDSKGNMHILFY